MWNNESCSEGGNDNKDTLCCYRHAQQIVEKLIKEVTSQMTHGLHVRDVLRNLGLLSQAIY